jgi:hypothetical protein
MVALLVARRADQTVISNSHSLAGQLQMLAGITVDVMQLMHEVRHMVNDGGSLLVGGSPE